MSTGIESHKGQNQTKAQDRLWLEQMTGENGCTSALIY